jgi:hypothetical protein
MMMLMEWNANSCTQPSFPYEFCLQRLASQHGHVARFSRPFDQVRSGTRMAQIGRAVVILQKKTFYFLKINSFSRGPLSIFCENNLRLFRNQPAIQIGWAPGFFWKQDIPFIENQPAL